MPDQMPLWEALPATLRRFNYTESLPRTAGSYLRVMAELERLRDRETPVVLTFSVFEDFVRVWHRFMASATKGKWQIVIGDSSGAMDPEKFPGAKLIRVPNHLYHGKKIDLLLRHVIGPQPVFLCDDDMYPLFDPSPYLEKLVPPDVAAVSLHPRPWFQFEIDGVRHDPMGSFALLFKPEIFAKEGLRFQPPQGIESARKVFAEGAKHLKTYDTGDYANEQLILRGYKILTERHQGFIGYDGMTAPRLVLQRFGKDWMKTAIERSEHYLTGSTNAAVLKAMIGSVSFERLYRALFREEPKVVSGFTDPELAGIIESNPRLKPEDKTRLHDYRRRLEETERRLISYAAHV